MIIVSRVPIVRLLLHSAPQEASHQRVERLSHMTSGIGGSLEEIKTDLGEKIDRISSRLNIIDDRLDKIEENAKCCFTEEAPGTN